MRLARLELARHSMLGTRPMPCARTDPSAACAVCSCREARGAAVRRSRRDQQRRDRHADGATRRRRIRRRWDGGRCSAMGAAGVKQQPHPYSPPHSHPHTHTQPHAHLPPHPRSTSLSTRCGSLRAGDRGRMCRCGWRAPVRQWGYRGWCDRGDRSRRGGGRMWGALDARCCVNGGLAGLSPLASRHVHMSVTCERASWIVGPMPM